MSKPFDMDTFLMQGENLINAELLCNEIDNFIDSYFRKELNSDTLEYPFSDGSDRYVYFCPPQKKDKKYIFEIGFGHRNEVAVFTYDEQERFKEKLNLVINKYHWEKHTGNWPSVHEIWACCRFYCDVNDMKLEYIKQLVDEVKGALDTMKE